MVFLYIIYTAMIIIIALVAIICLKIKLAGMNVSDFFNFIKAINNLDNLYNFSKNTTKMSKVEQVVFLQEAEKVFDIFEKIPSMIWEDEYHKYSFVLQTYKDIRLLRWANA